MGNVVSGIRAIIEGTAVTGGLAGILATALAIWIIVYWFMDNCSFDDDRDCKMLSPSENAERSDQRNVQLILAFIALVPSVMVIVFMLLNFGSGISKSVRGRRRRRSRRR